MAAAEDGPIKLHLGCGQKYRAGYVHGDLCKAPHIAHFCDVRDLRLLYKEGTVDEIYICHALEHLTRKEAKQEIEDFYALLKPGGKAFIAVPDLEAAFQVYARTRNLGQIMGLLYGGQRDGLDFHTVGFDFATLSALCQGAGFRIVQRYDAHEYLAADGPDYDDYSLAYMPHKDRSGTLVSLNVVAQK